MNTDRFTVRAVAIGLILLALAVVAALVWILSSVELTAEQKGGALATLAALGTGALGAGASLLAHTNSDAPPPAPVPSTPPTIDVAPTGLVPGPG